MTNHFLNSECKDTPKIYIYQYDMTNLIQKRAGTCPTRPI